LIHLVRCGDEVFLSNSASGIERFNVRTAARGKPIEPGRLMALSLAADCPARTLYALSLPARGEQHMAVVAFDVASGRQIRRIDLPTQFLAHGTGHVVDGAVYFGGMWVAPPEPARRYQSPPPAAYYRDKKLALRISLDDGIATPVVDPYEQRCPGAGACIRSVVAPFAGGWLVAQPFARQVAVLDKELHVVRTFDASSPLMQSNGVSIPSNDSAEPMLRWAARNSSINAVYAYASGDIALVHSVVDLPEGWTFGQPAQFRAWMNVHDASGKQLITDLALPELPIGHDDDSIYVADYGPSRRTGSHDAVTIVRIPVRSQR
jgi:hypothetical protein